MSIYFYIIYKIWWVKILNLANRALSHVSIRNSRRGTLDLLDKAYRMLRFLRTAGVQFGEDMYEYKEITKGARRYEVDDDKTLGVVRSFFEELLTSFEEDTFTHYLIPHKIQKVSKRVRGPAPGEVRRKVLVLLSENTANQVSADASRTLMEVPYLGSYEWYYFLEKTLVNLFKQPEDLFHTLKRETLQYVADTAPMYTSKYLKDYLRENPAPRSRKRKGVRLFSDLPEEKEQEDDSEENSEENDD
jgi:hypothetical protein